ncbi:MAG: hypothetical protein ACLRFH_00795 [Opitutales bacterium]
MTSINVQGQAPLQSLPQTNTLNPNRPDNPVTQTQSSLTPISSAQNQPSSIQQTPNLEQARPATGIQAEAKRSKPIQENDSTNKGTVTITEQISSGRHPHLDETTNKSVQDYFNTKKTDKKEDVDTLISNLKDMDIIDDDGNINFGNLNPNSKEDSRFVSDLKKLAAKAGIKGKIFKNEEGQFDFEITGKCSEEAKTCMKALKEKLNDIKDNTEPKLEVNININPEAVGPLSVNDQRILANGGQIQYRSLPGGDIMKLTLDPSKNNGEGALRVDVFDENCVTSKSTSGNIPLKVVFEGQELNGKKVGPFLKDWRSRQLFENSIIKENFTNFTPGIHRWDRFDGSNENDVNRIQSQDTLWNAVNEYLKASVEITEGHFKADNKEPNASAGIDTSNGEDHQSESYSISPENNSSATASTIQENSSHLKGSQETIYNLSDGMPGNIDTSEELKSPKGSIKTKGNGEQNAVLRNGFENVVDLAQQSLEVNIQPNSITTEKSPSQDLDIQEVLPEGNQNKKSIKATFQPPQKSKDFWGNLDNLKKLNTESSENEINVENLEATAEIAKKKTKATRNGKAAGKDNWEELLKASSDLAKKMKGLLSGLNDEETIDESSNIKPNTTAIENPGQKLLEKKGLALKIQLNEIQQELNSKWVFHKNHGLENPDAFKQEITNFNNAIKETYNNEKDYWDKFTSWYAKKNGGSPVVKK